jgi:hypothetical protein
MHEMADCSRCWEKTRGVWYLGNPTRSHHWTCRIEREKSIQHGLLAGYEIHEGFDSQFKKNAIIFSILVYSNSTQNKGEGSGGDLEIGRVAPARDREGAREDQLNWEEESEEESEMEDRETLAAGEAWAAGAGVATMAADQRTHFFFFTRD